MTIWGSTFVVTKSVVDELPTATLAFLRFAIATLILLPVVLVRGGWPRGLPWLRLAFMALTGGALFTIAFNLGLFHGSAGQGAVLYALIPAATAGAAAVALRERLTRGRIAGIALSLAGVVIVVATARGGGVSAPAPWLGAAWMLGSVVAWTVYTIAAKPLAAADQIAVIAVVSGLTTAMLLPFAGWEVARDGWPRPSREGWLAILYLGAFGSAACYLLFNLGLRHLEASTVGVLVNIDPIVGVLTAWLVLGEAMTVPQMVGAAVVVSGMWLATRPDRAQRGVE